MDRSLSHLIKFDNFYKFDTTESKNTMGLLAEKMMKKKIKQLEDLLDAEMLVNEKLAEMVAELKKENQELKQGQKPAPSKYNSRKNDPRITVHSCEDRKEYNRQVMYLNKHPDCQYIAPRRWTKKNRKSESASKDQSEGD